MNQTACMVIQCNYARIEHIVHTRVHAKYTRDGQKEMETFVKDTHFFINKELGHCLSVKQSVSFLE